MSIAYNFHSEVLKGNCYFVERKKCRGIAKKTLEKGR